MRGGGICPVCGQPLLACHDRALRPVAGVLVWVHRACQEVSAAA